MYAIRSYYAFGRGSVGNWRSLAGAHGVAESTERYPRQRRLERRHQEIQSVRRSLVALLVAMLAGCATVGDRPAVKDPQAAWHERQAQLLPLKDWRIQGRVSARTTDDGWQA